MKEVHMSPVAEPRVEQSSIIDDIEKRMGEIFSAQKSEVEQGLIEKIKREKVEAQKRIEAVNQEFTQVRGFLETHKVVMAELQATEEHLRGEIRGHFDRAQNYQKMMENAAGLAGEELEKIGGLHGELERVRLKAEGEYTNIKKSLSGYAGIAAQIPSLPEIPDGDVNWNEELLKLKKVRDLLASLRQVDFAPAPARVAAAAPVEAPAPVEAFAPVPAPAPAAAVMPPAPSTGHVTAEEDGVRDDSEFADGDPAWADIPGTEAGNLMVSPALADEPYEEAAVLPAEPQAGAAPAGPAPDAKHASLLAALASYRRTEPINNGLEIGFFGAEASSVLDAESFMTAVGKIVESANQLHAQLTQTGSVKDLFLLKQEILNQQEVLRKIFFRVVRFCDKEGGQLPETLSEIISAQGMKDIIERLTMANWSDPSDFRPFLSELTAMKRAFEVRMVASGGGYFRSVLDQVEGRN
jgi:hypothetical protein